MKSPRLKDKQRAPGDPSPRALDNDLLGLTGWRCYTCCAKVFEQCFIRRRIGLFCSVDFDVRDAENASARTIWKLLFESFSRVLLKLSATVSSGTCFDRRKV